MGLFLAYRKPISDPPPATMSQPCSQVKAAAASLKEAHFFTAKTSAAEEAQPVASALQAPKKCTFSQNDSNGNEFKF